MKKEHIKEIPVEAIRADMILAKDVLTKEGFVLLARDTMLNDINCTQLRAKNIDFVHIRTYSIDENSSAIDLTSENTIDGQKTPINDRSHFKQFEDTYEKSKNMAKKHLVSISEGGEVNLKTLTLLTKNIIETVKCKSDIFSFISVLRQADDHIFTHSCNVALLCSLFAHWLAFDEVEASSLIVAGMLHDIGKIKTPPEILNKKGQLTTEEFDIMKQHTEEGFLILQKKGIPHEIKTAALMHHERIDGSGYPFGTKGAFISRFAKIVAICDIYDAMVSSRIYREKHSPFDVIHTFENRVYGEVDTSYLLIFLQNIAYTYIGTWVYLSDGQPAEVVFVNQNRLSRPIVRLENGNMIDLAYNKNLKIVSIV